MSEEVESVKKSRFSKGRVIFFGILSIFLLMGSSYALIYFAQNYQSDLLVINGDILTVSITENGNVAINDAVGQKDKDGINNAKTTFNITNNSNTEVRAIIRINEDSASTMNSQKVRGGLFKDDVNHILNICNIGDNGNTLGEVIIAKGETVTILSTIWLDYYYDGYNEKFSGKYEVIPENADWSGYIYLQKLVGKDKGIVKVSDTEYRYNNAKSDNYVSFNNEIWRILGVFNNQIEIIRDDVLPNGMNIDTYYNSIIEEYKKLIDSKKKPVLVANKDTYTTPWLSNVNVLKLTLKKGVYIVSGNGKSSNPYIINDDIYIPVR